MSELKWSMFMGAIEHQHIDYVEEILQGYDIGKYIIGMETATDSHQETKGQHLHFAVEMTDKDYHKFSKRVFIDRFKLRGRAVKDKPRQYGRVKRIENVSNMLAYTVKDGNVRTNMKEEELQIFREKSYSKHDEKEEWDELVEYLGKVELEDMRKDKVEGFIQGRDMWEFNRERNYNRLCRSIIQYYIEKDLKKSLSKIMIESKVRKYLMYYHKGDDYNTEDKVNWMYNILFIR